MLRIDQIPLTEYLSILTALTGVIRDADADAEKCRANGWANVEQWTRVARESRAAKALLESHRYPRLAELAAVAS